jgi:DNA-binding NtrC family response regulator
VVATTSRSLVDMLDANEFSPTLYYRLNTVYVDLS